MQKLKYPRPSKVVLHKDFTDYTFTSLTEAAKWLVENGYCNRVSTARAAFANIRSCRLNSYKGFTLSTSGITPSRRSKLNASKIHTSL